MRLLSFFAKRYIAGVDIDDAIRAARELNGRGIGAAIDNLGEDVTRTEEAASVVAEYRALIEEISNARLNAYVSLKLTHIGLDISTELAANNAEKIIDSAHGRGLFVRFDMEGARYTQRTIDVFLGLRERRQNVGIAIQSCLKRSGQDARALIERGANIRLVKGAYKEPPDIAYADKKDVDANFAALMKGLLINGTNPAIATHDERLIDLAKRLAHESNIPKDHFSFEMLLGIKRSLQRRLAEEGYCVRVYVPYGRNWLPYTMRRLRERKENIWFVVKNIFD